MLAIEVANELCALFGPGATHQTSPGEERGAQVLGVEMVQLSHNGERRELAVELRVVESIRMGHRGLAHDLFPTAFGNGWEASLQHSAHGPPDARALLSTTKPLPPASGQPVREQWDQALHDPVVFIHQAQQGNPLV
jgi:hypothetical protein